jgi:hypothetical protein
MSIDAPISVTKILYTLHVSADYYAVQEQTQRGGDCFSMRAFARRLPLAPIP